MVVQKKTISPDLMIKYLNDRPKTHIIFKKKYFLFTQKSVPQ